LRHKPELPRKSRTARTGPFVLGLAGLLGGWLAAARAAAPSAFASEAAPASAAAVAPAYKLGRASPDGIGKFYQGREIAQVMGFSGAPWLDRPSREQEERPDWLIEELRLEPSMSVADIGAGSGYLERRLAPLLPQGRIYAVDVQPEMIELLQDLALQPDTRNVVPVLGLSDDVRLPAASVDLAVMVDVYHELAFPAEIIRSLLRSLRPGGRLVFVEYRAEDPAVAIKPLHKMSEAQIRREMRPFPVIWERTSERLPVQHIVVFRKP
jgi:ubiquinone/menaquinone biosynthesis C-methylase UbiE